MVIAASSSVVGKASSTTSIAGRALRTESPEIEPREALEKPPELLDQRIIEAMLLGKLGARLRARHRAADRDWSDPRSAAPEKTPARSARRATPGCAGTVCRDSAPTRPPLGPVPLFSRDGLADHRRVRCRPPPERTHLSSSDHAPDHGADQGPSTAPFQASYDEPASAPLTGGTPRSLQILRARWSWISRWRGTAERRLRPGLCHHECRPPSRNITQPCFLRCRRSSSRFIRRSGSPRTRHRPPRALRAD